MSMLSIGIDPSWSSGSLTLGSITSRKTEIVESGPMPESAPGLIEILEDWLPRAEYVFMEAIPKFAGENRSASHMSGLQTNYGFLEGSILMHQTLLQGPLLQEFVPAKWMNLIGFKERPRDRNVRKKELQRICREMFPDRKWSLASSDSPLILEAGRKWLIENELL